MYKYKEDDFVEFDMGELQGCGYIKGVALESIAVLGVTYIVQWEFLRGPKGWVSHDYSCIPVFEHFIKKVED